MARPHHDSEWTLAELARRVDQVLSVDCLGAPNGRVREVPDVRAIRYYTTLGLMDRPGRMRGRTALYGKRHLRQLVAVKRLQHEGLPLAAIQQRLAGLCDKALSQIARVPTAVEDAPAVPPPDNRSAPRPKRPAHGQREAFWARVPEVKHPSEQTGREESPVLMQAVRLDADVVLLLYGARVLTAKDADALQSAAASLMDALTQRGFIQSAKERGNR